VIPLTFVGGSKLLAALSLSNFLDLLLEKLNSQTCTCTIHKKLNSKIVMINKTYMKQDTHMECRSHL